MFHTTRLIAAGALAALVTVSCASASAPAATKRTIVMSAVEYKGSTEVAKEPFPASPAPSGGGYQLKAPADGKTWENSTYRWEPGTIVVYQGDDVDLQIWGVNGAVHPGKIEGYDKTFSVKRGQLTSLSFKADKAGLFRILCDVHNPSMTGTLVVLAR